MEFKVVKDNEVITCKIVLTFKDDNNNINYVLYTDGSKNDKNKLEVYASRYNIVDGELILEDILHDYEWNLVNNMYKSLRGN